MNTLAAAALAFTLPFAALAQSAPPSAPPLDYAPQAVQAAPAVIVEAVAPEEGALDLTQYPVRQRNELWARYARKNQLSVNVLYPIGGTMLSGMVSGFWMGLGFKDPVAVFSVPFEYERSLTRNFSLFGVVQPTWATGRGQSEVTCALGTGARYYFTGNAPQGVWTGMEIDHALGSRAVTVRSELGHNAIFDNGLTLSFGVGLGLTYSPDTVIPLTNISIPILPAAGLRLSVGYAI